MTFLMDTCWWVCESARINDLVKVQMSFSAKKITLTNDNACTTTQMGSKYKAALIPRRIRETIHGWGKATRKKRRRRRSTWDDSTVHTETSTVCSLTDEDEDDYLYQAHYDRADRGRSRHMKRSSGRMGRTKKASTIGRPRGGHLSHIAGALCTQWSSIDRLEFSWNSFICIVDGQIALSDYTRRT